MLFAIHSGKINNKNCNDIIYLVMRLEKALNNTKFVFCDRHPLNPVANFSNNPQKINIIDWSVMGSQSWQSTTEQPNRKSIRQAEFLIYEWVDLELIDYIGVKNKYMENLINSLINERYDQEDKTPQILIRKNWYFCDEHSHYSG